MKRLVFTSGDINGIGPEICLKTFNKCFKKNDRKIIFLCPENIFEKTADLITPKFNYEVVNDESFIKSDNNIISIVSTGKPKQSVGRPTGTSGRFSYKAILKAVELLQNKMADAMITAPISKVSFEMAKIDFPGHTELLAKLTKSKNYVMMFLSEKLKAAMFTIHIPLSKVSENITKNHLITVLNVVENSLRNDFKISSPKISVLGLNPHSGEEGRIGSEEKEIISPVIIEYESCVVDGPFVPDAFFGNHSYKKYDMTIGMYHDQILVPFKLLSFSSGVNYTAGLPIIRTSPDHGTAFDIAGKNIADCSSMVSALNWAEKIILNHNEND